MFAILSNLSIITRAQPNPIIDKKQKRIDFCTNEEGKDVSSDIFIGKEEIYLIPDRKFTLFYHTLDIKIYIGSLKKDVDFDYNESSSRTTLFRQERKNESSNWGEYKIVNFEELTDSFEIVSNLSEIKLKLEGDRFIQVEHYLITKSSTQVCQKAVKKTLGITDDNIKNIRFKVQFTIKLKKKSTNDFITLIVEPEELITLNKPMGD
ncbi:hypothetical protein CDIK_4126 [Cucumispora dikerogammari]|nr:hypothetical protein CDIK_4126 [Cucumispora dikerogammari]